MADLAVLSPPTPGKVILDTFVRAAKTAVATFIGIMGVSITDAWNVTAARSALFASAAAGATVILNLIISWANSE